MENKYLSFRFDVDTHKCMKEGVPILVDLAKKKNIKFTFFINFGRAVNRYAYLLNLLLNKKNISDIKKFSNVKKLGIYDFLIAGILNPKIGVNNINFIKKMQREGHEVAVHGGLNHADWQKNFKQWDVEKIKIDLEYVLKIMDDNNLKRPAGFSSPGWNGSKKLNSILQLHGYKYSADLHGDGNVIKKENERLTQLSTNILGEPGGVGYLEYCRASLFSDQEVIDNFLEKIKKQNINIFYDHPTFVALHELDLFEKLIDMAIERNYKIVNLKDLILA